MLAALQQSLQQFTALVGTAQLVDYFPVGWWGRVGWLRGDEQRGDEHRGDEGVRGQVCSASWRRGSGLGQGMFEHIHLGGGKAYSSDVGAVPPWILHLPAPAGLAPHHAHDRASAPAAGCGAGGG